MDQGVARVGRTETMTWIEWQDLHARVGQLQERAAYKGQLADPVDVDENDACWEGEPTDPDPPDPWTMTERETR